MFEDVLAIVRYQFPNLEIAPDACIEELGGTSLDFVELELAMESVLGHLPNDWHRTQLSKLASDAEANKVGAKRATRFDQLSARSLCCILVVFVHVVGYEIGAGLQLPRDHWLHSFNELAEYFKMPLFAFAAGLTFSMQGAASKDPSTFLGSTIKSLILPMVGTMMVFYGLSTAIGSDAGAPHTAWWYPLINSYAHFWFIQSLILILIGSYAVTRYAPGLNTTYGLLLICAPLIAVPYFQTSFLSIAGIGVLAPFFALGFLFDAPKGRTKICVDGIVQNIWYLATAAIAAALIAYFGFDKLYLMPHFAAFLIGLPIVVLVLLYASLIPGLKRLAPYTFYIFLWHVFATSPMRRILYSIGIEDTFTHIVFGMAVGLGVPILAVIVMKRLGVFRFVEGRW